MGVGYFAGERVARFAAQHVPAAVPDLGYGTVFAKMVDSFERERSEILAKSMQPDRMAHFLDPERGSLERAALLPSGRERLAMLQKNLDSFGLIRSKNQRFFHRQMTQAIIKKIFKSDLPENLDSLREEFGIDQFKSEVMIITPRRWGKTYSVAMFVAAVAASIERTEQAIFSTGRRASEKLLQLIYQLLCKLPGMKVGALRSPTPPSSEESRFSPLLTFIVCFV